MTMNALIQTEDLRNQLESTNPPILIDVRLEDDFKTAHIPRAINNCVFEVAFQKRLVAAVPDRTQPIIVYGADSESHEARIAAEKLRRAGYTTVYEYREGFASWQYAGAPVIRGEQRPGAPRISDGIHLVDVTASSVEWNGRNLLNKHYGRIALSSGQLEFLQGTELHDVLINHLQSDDFFDVARFPNALYVINATRRVEGATSGQPNIEIAGDLTLKGISSPLTFRAAAGVTPDGKAAAQAVFSFDRTRWNILYGSGRYFHRLGMHLVNDLVDLEIKIVTH